MYYYNQELYHHGILGQRWGIRRFQNKNGTLTQAGKKRYSENVENAKNEVKNAKERYNTARKKYNMAFTYASQKKAAKTLGKADDDLRIAKRMLKYEKAKNSMSKSSDSDKSKRRLALEGQYKSKGMSDEEASVYAYKREQTEKIVKAVGAVTLSAGAAYVAYKHYDKTVDTFLNKGDILKRVSGSDSSNLHDVFYAAKSNRDANRYAGYLGTNILKNNPRVFQKDINVTDQIKVASEKNASNIFRKMLENDSDAMQEAKTKIHELNRSAGIGLMGASPKQIRVLEKADAAISKGKVDDNVYKAFNLGLVERGSKTSDKFFSELKKHGYGAIADINDKELSGYNTKTATIVFDTAKTAVSNVREISADEANKRNLIEAGKDATKAIITSVAEIGAAVGAANSVANALASKRQDQIVAEYRKEHPETKMTYNEILKSQLRKK